MKSKKIIYGGTLGDTLIVLSKLNLINKYYGLNFDVKRANNNTSLLDSEIKDLCKLYSFINYSGCDHIKRNTSYSTLEKLYKDRAVISASWNLKLTHFDKKYKSIFNQKPIKLKLTKKINKKKDISIIGIQLSSGKKGTNHKSINLNWIIKLIEKLKSNKIKIYLFGYYPEDKDIGDFLEKKYVFCNSKVLKINFIEWCEHINSLDYFITPEGFSLFFALNQNIKTFSFAYDKYVIKNINKNSMKNLIIFTKNYGIMYRLLGLKFLTKLKEKYPINIDLITEYLNKNLI